MYVFDKVCNELFFSTEAYVMTKTKQSTSAKRGSFFLATTK